MTINEARDAQGLPCPKEHFGYTDGISDPVFEGQYAAGEEQALVGASRRQTIAVRDCIHQRFARQVAATPERVALEWGGAPGEPGSSLSYAELESWTNAVARRLVAAGVGAEVLVGLWFERSIELVVGVLVAR